MSKELARTELAVENVVVDLLSFDPSKITHEIDTSMYSF